MEFTVGQRVRTTAEAPAAWVGATSAPAGSIGTIVYPLNTWGSYGVVLDNDPDRLPADYRADELTSA